MVLCAGLVADGRGHLPHQRYIEGRGQADCLRKHRGLPCPCHAMQPLIPPVVGGHTQPFDCRRGILHLRGLLFQGHLRDECGGPLLEACRDIQPGPWRVSRMQHRHAAQDEHGGPATPRTAAGPGRNRQSHLLLPVRSSRAKGQQCAHEAACPVRTQDGAVHVACEQLPALPVADVERERVVALVAGNLQAQRCRRRHVMAGQRPRAATPSRASRKSERRPRQGHERRGSTSTPRSGTPPDRRRHRGWRGHRGARLEAQVLLAPEKCRIAQRVQILGKRVHGQHAGALVQVSPGMPGHAHAQPLAIERWAIKIVARHEIAGRRGLRCLALHP